MTYLFLGLAAGFVGLDKFFGISSSWMRFTTTQMHLEQSLAEFEVDWAIVSTSVSEGQPTHEQALEFFKLIKSFRLKMHELNRSESSDWAEEFRAALERMQRQTAAQGKAGEGA